VATVEAEAVARNLTGRAEQLRASVSYAPMSHSNAFSASLRQPRVGGAAADLTLEALQARG
jgi:hypothetical protein